MLGLMGIGRMWSPKTGWGNAADVLKQNGLDLIQYKPKEVRFNGITFCFCFSTFCLNFSGFNNDQWDTIHHSIRS